jgi:phosphoribosylformimino-5-aminoimidazole carboxamide ribonucleotide (ProFAR) isomerase
MTYNALVKDFPGIDWGNFFLAQGFPPFSHIDVGQLEPIHEVEKILAEESLDDLKAYAESHAISSAAGYLDDNFRAVEFELGKVMSGVQQDRPRWKRATALVSGVLGEAIGKLYVEKYFPESSKQQMLQLVRNLQKALSQRIDEATWMSPATKAQAQDKLANFIVKVGYPDTWKDYTNLHVDEQLSLFENMQNIRAFLSQDYISRKVNKPVDKAEWQMTPQTVNAYYNPTTNEICFPAAILQPPFFDPNVDFGGGIKTDEDLVIAFDNGAQMVTLGSVAVKNPGLFKKWLEQYGNEKIILGADVKKNKISVNGWKEESQQQLIPFLKDYTKEGVFKVLCTDISRDGMLQGPSVELYQQILKEFPNMHLIASGGVSCIQDIIDLEIAKVPAVVFGKALYEGKITLKDLNRFM